jgi:hypothetical protein
MKLITNLDMRQRGKYKKRFGLFFCPACKKEVEKPMDVGKSADCCGCFKKNKTHGESKTRLFRLWSGMKTRCTNPKRNRYYCYGERGIKVCKEWSDSYIVFRDWALTNGYQENLTIDRINNNGNYEPNNCQWITQKENNLKCSRIKLTKAIVEEIRAIHKTRKYKGKDLARMYNITYGYLCHLLYVGGWE